MPYVRTDMKVEIFLQIFSLFFEIGHGQEYLWFDNLKVFLLNKHFAANFIKYITVRWSVEFTQAIPLWCKGNFYGVSQVHKLLSLLEELEE